MAIPAMLPDNEPERLDALRRYGILDTAAEPAFDGLVEIASHICEAPMALISLIDEDRQWFKARVGLDAQETSRSLAFCAHAILEPGTLFEVADAREDERFHDNPLTTSAPDIRAYAGMPLTDADGFSLGTLCVLDRVPRRFTPEQRRMLELLSQQVTDQLDRRRQLMAAAENERVLTAVMDSVAAEIVYYDADDLTRAWNSQYERNFKASVGRSPQQGEPMTALIRERAQSVGMPESVVREFLMKRRSYHENPVGDLPVDLPDGRALLIREVPVVGGGNVTTLVDVTPLRKAERALEQRAKDLQILSQTDSLTELANRRHFLSIANRECERAERYGRPLSLISFDIDHFKTVNDSHGHEVGDQVLVFVAQLVDQEARDQDLVGRIGGEEFAILLPETGSADALAFAERVRRKIADSKAFTSAGRVQVTVSAGVTQRLQGEIGVENAMRRADELLYTAKKGGRNRVCAQPDQAIAAC